MKNKWHHPSEIIAWHLQVERIIQDGKEYRGLFYYEFTSLVSKYDKITFHSNINESLSYLCHDKCCGGICKILDGLNHDV